MKTIEQRAQEIVDSGYGKVGFRDHLIAGITVALTTVAREQREADAQIAEDVNNISMVGGSTGDACGTSRRIAAAIRAAEVGG